MESTQTKKITDTLSIETQLDTVQVVKRGLLNLTLPQVRGLRKLCVVTTNEKLNQENSANLREIIGEMCNRILQVTGEAETPKELLADLADIHYENEPPAEAI